MFSKKLHAAVAALTLGALASLPAQAAVPAAVEGVFTGLSADFGTLQGYAWPVIIAITGGMIVMGLVVKVAKRAGRG